MPIKQEACPIAALLGIGHGMDAAQILAHVGTCAIVGLPNVGKSTLLNRLLGVRLMAVSPKPQTTRNRVLGVVNHDHKDGASQLVFLDTPGIQRGRGGLRRFMRDEALAAAGECDVVLLLIDGTDRTQNSPSALLDSEASALAETAEMISAPMILGINKVDRIKEKDRLLPMLEAFGSEKRFSAFVPFSAKTGKGVDSLLAAICDHCPEGPRLFPDDMMTNRPERFFAAELIREQLFRQLGQEIPYATAVEIERFDERERKNDVVIHAAIHVERDSQKAIVIGKGGARLKTIGQEARRVISELLGLPVHVKLFVKVTPDWSDKPRDLHEFGIQKMNKPLIAIVGRPNVGKSTLFNRIVGGRPALVHDEPGMTRDRRYGEAEYFGHNYRIVDTGGLDPSAESEVIGAGIHRHAYAALSEADVVFFVVDARAGATPLDYEVAKILRRVGCPVYLVANKVDSPKGDDLIHGLYELGFGVPYPISAEHGRGVDALIESWTDTLEKPNDSEAFDAFDNALDASLDPKDQDSKPLRFAFVGKPNAGKSSLFNRLFGGERALVHDQPGTTTDPIDTDIEIAGKPYVVVDTAGIRRRTKVDKGAERISVSLALNQIERADVVAITMDATLGPTAQDVKLANRAIDAGRAIVLVFNKSDLLSREQVKVLWQQVEDTMSFLSFCPRLLVSAERGDGMLELLKAIDHVSLEHQKRVSTSEINRFFAEVCETHPPPTKGSRRVTIHYITQGGSRPPTFVMWANRPLDIEKAYTSFIKNQLRLRYVFKGSPIRLIVKGKIGRAAKPKSGKRGARKKR